MALFKISYGLSGGLDSKQVTEGHCWFTPDNAQFYIDAKTNSDSEEVERIRITGVDKNGVDIDNTTYLKLDSGGSVKGGVNILNTSGTSPVISLGQNGYITGTWLRSTANNHLTTTPTQICVQQDGWIYYRTLDELKTDLSNNFTREDISITQNSSTITLSQAVPSLTNLQVFYNGILLVLGTHYNATSGSDIITFLDFQAQVGDVITVYYAPNIDSSVALTETQITNIVNSIIDSYRIKKYSITLYVNEWTNSNTYILDTLSGIEPNGYQYMINPTSDSIQSYAAANIKAQDITQSNQVVFRCDSKPTTNINVEIMKIPVVLV